MRERTRSLVLTAETWTISQPLRLPLAPERKRAREDSQLLIRRASERRGCKAKMGKMRRICSRFLQPDVVVCSLRFNRLPHIRGNDRGCNAVQECHPAVVFPGFFSLLETSESQHGSLLVAQHCGVHQSEVQEIQTTEREAGPANVWRHTLPRVAGNPCPSRSGGQSSPEPAGNTWSNPSGSDPYRSTAG